MIVIKLILLILAFFVTLLWFTKLVTDFASAAYGSTFSEEAAEKDGVVRLYLIVAMSVLWPLVIIIM